MTDPIRIDRLTEPAVAGRMYLVPTVKAKWIGRLGIWPVIGPLHEDAEIFNFDKDHYHVDARFLPPRFHKPEKAFVYPLHADAITAVWRRRKCIRAYVPYTLPGGRDTSPVFVLRGIFAGHQCERGKGGWICPHRKASLGSLSPVNGVITCPLHGLRIDAETGIVLTPEAQTPPSQSPVQNRTTADP